VRREFTPVYHVDIAVTVRGSRWRFFALAPSSCPPARGSPCEVTASIVGLDAISRFNVVTDSASWRGLVVLAAAALVGLPSIVRRLGVSRQVLGFDRRYRLDSY
jgi:hypothetical protein